MTKEALLQLGLTEEQADQVLGLHTETIQDLVPKDKLAEAATERDNLANALQKRDNQLNELQNSVGDNKGLQKQLADAIAKNEADSRAAAEAFAAYKKNNAVDLHLMKAGAKNPIAVKALLDLEKVSVDGDNLLGLTDQLEALKTSDAYLFDTVPLLSGREPGAGSGGGGYGNTKDNPFKKETWNLTKQAALYKENPELAKKMAAAAGVSVPWLKFGRYRYDKINKCDPAGSIHTLRYQQDDGPVRAHTIRHSCKQQRI